MERGGHVSAATKPSDRPGEQTSDAASGQSAGSHAAAQPLAPGAVPAAQRGHIYTMTAQEGLDVAELVNAAFGSKTIGALTPRRVEVVAPDGPSTAGGKRARQTIRLVPANGDGHPVMCGYLDPARKVVELRSHRSVLQQYEERFAKRFDVTETEYAALCEELESTLGVFRYTFVHEAAAPSAVQVVRTQKGAVEPPVENLSRLNLIILGLAVLIVAGVVAAMFLR